MTDDFVEHEWNAFGSAPVPDCDDVALMHQIRYLATDPALPSNASGSQFIALFGANQPCLEVSRLGHACCWIAGVQRPAHDACGLSTCALVLVMLFWHKIFWKCLAI
jgi:hypothetical protein